MDKVSSKSSTMSLTNYGFLKWAFWYTLLFNRVKINLKPNHQRLHSKTKHVFDLFHQPPYSIVHIYVWKQIEKFEGILPNLHVVHLACVGAQILQCLMVWIEHKLFGQQVVTLMTKSSVYYIKLFVISWVLPSGFIQFFTKKSKGCNT